MAEFPKSAGNLPSACDVFLVLDLCGDLGEKTAESLSRSDRSLQGGSLTESNYVLQGILQTNTVCGTMRAQQLHAGRREVGLETYDINLFLSSGLHLRLLVYFRN
jgi:hypothetical protein